MSTEAIPKTKPCTKCGIDKPLEDFAKNRTNRDGHVSICKTCFNKNTRAKVHANKNNFPF
jgi:hypothetical protein